MYPGTEIATNGSSYGARDNDLAVSMGFVTSPGSDFWLWSREERNEGIAYCRYFGSTRTYRYDSIRYMSYIQAVCLAE